MVRFLKAGFGSDFSILQKLKSASNSTAGRQVKSGKLQSIGTVLALGSVSLQGPRRLSGQADPVQRIAKEATGDRNSYSRDFQEREGGLFSGNGRVVGILGYRQGGPQSGFLGSSPVCLTCYVITGKSLNLSEAQAHPPYALCSTLKSKSLPMLEV